MQFERDPKMTWSDFRLRLRRALSQHCRDGVPLPPLQLRAAGPLFVRDVDFVGFAQTDVTLLQRSAQITDARLLDFGCGCSRLYYGFSRFSVPSSYLGLDIRLDAIEWASTQITARNPQFTYRHLDIRNDRYNRSGKMNINEWASVINDRFDLIYCYSVFSHLEVSDARELLVD